MKRPSIISAYLALVLAAAFYAPVFAQNQGSDLVMTVAGQMTLIDGYSSEDGGLTLLVAGKPILKDRSLALASVLKTVPEQGAARIVVLGVSTGGNGCPLMLRIIDLGIRPVYVSPTFGTCYDDVAVSVQKGGRLRITQPNPGDEESEGSSVWLYHKGVLSSL
jgi:hypothetical protein